jgi:hypothetical protein
MSVREQEQIISKMIGDAYCADDISTLHHIAVALVVHFASAGAASEQGYDGLPGYAADVKFGHVMEYVTEHIAPHVKVKEVV